MVVLVGSSSSGGGGGGGGGGRARAGNRRQRRALGARCGGNRIDRVRLGLKNKNPFFKKQNKRELIDFIWMTQVFFYSCQGSLWTLSGSFFSSPGVLCCCEGNKMITKLSTDCLLACFTFIEIDW